jgi:hypothetical protein
MVRRRQKAAQVDTYSVTIENMKEGSFIDWEQDWRSFDAAERF